MDLIKQLNETVLYIRSRSSRVPKVGIVLGSGLGNLVEEIAVDIEIPYDEIPHFPVTTVEGHSGKLILGKISGKPVVAMSGRFHYYEGYPAHYVVYPIRALKYLGVETLVISNAAGGINSSLRVGDLMIITDHISLFVANPLIGKNEEAIGLRFPDMSEPYNRRLISRVKEIAAGLQIPLKEGVYAGVTGPTFETRSEYRMLHLVGCDAVGMSTVQEVIAAVHTGMKVVAVSVITDMGIREDDNIITHEEVLHAAAAAEPKLSAIFRELVAEL
ncbi:MAG TPA: purine-nucleoside phosphorylase [Puia sp.]|nr:purine-nucleoside phosphorylase [Puia sp.]